MSRRSIFFCVLVCGFIVTGAVPTSAQVQNPRVTIESVHSVHLDTTFQVRVFFTPGEALTTDLGYFNLLLEYDTAAATLLSVDAGADLAACGWEQFLWAAGGTAGCAGNPCPTGVVRLLARADLNNGPPGPLCLSNDLTEIAVLTFKSSADYATWDCQFSPIKFVWYACDDNIAMESVDLDSVYVSDRVLDYAGIIDVSQDLPFPTTFGAPSSCIPFGVDGKVIGRAIDFQHGGIDIICSDSIDNRGDINLNGIAYELADWVLFTNFLTLGPIVFQLPAEQADASDANANGITLELNDLVYLYRVVIGDANPFPRPMISPNATAAVTQDGNTNTIRIRYPGNITTAWFVFGDSIVPTCAFQTHVAAYDDAYTTPYTRVLVLQSNPGGPLADFPPMDTSRVIINYTGNGRLLYAEVANDGLEYIPVSIDYVNVPSCCKLRGNVNGIGQIDVADLTALVAYIFQDAFPPPPCPEEADVDGSGGTSPVTVSDITYFVSYLFQGGNPPAPCP